MFLNVSCFIICSGQPAKERGRMAQIPQAQQQKVVARQFLGGHFHLHLQQAQIVIIENHLLVMNHPLLVIIEPQAWQLPQQQPQLQQLQQQQTQQSQLHQHTQQLPQHHLSLHQKRCPGSCWNICLGISPLAQASRGRTMFGWIIKWMKTVLDEQCLDESLSGWTMFGWTLYCSGLQRGAPAQQPQKPSSDSESSEWDWTRGGLGWHVILQFILLILFKFCSHSICYSILMTFILQTLFIQELFILQMHSCCNVTHVTAFIVHVTAGAAGAWSCCFRMWKQDEKAEPFMGG